MSKFRESWLWSKILDLLAKMLDYNDLCYLFDEKMKKENCGGIVGKIKDVKDETGDYTQINAQRIRASKIFK